MKKQYVFVFVLAALIFALSSVFLKFNFTLYGLGFIPATFSRFFIGFVLMFLWVIYKKESLRPNKPGLLIWRGALNALAVIGFFLAITLTTITKSNLLSQMYPAFILIIAPFINKEKTTAIDLIWLGLMMVGAFLAIVPKEGLGSLFEGGSFVGDLVAILDAVVSAFAVCVLREARKHDSTSLVILWQFGTGTLIAIALLPFGWITPPNAQSWLLLIATGLCGFIGQVLITWGYKHVKSSTGGMVLYTGIIFSAIFGIMFFDETLSLLLIAGGVLIMGSLLGLTLLQNKRAAS